MLRPIFLIFWNIFDFGKLWNISFNISEHENSHLYLINMNSKKNMVWTWGKEESNKYSVILNQNISDTDILFTCICPKVKGIYIYFTVLQIIPRLIWRWYVRNDRVYKIDHTILCHLTTGIWLALLFSWICVE